MSLAQLKKDAKTLYARGHLSQSHCCDILGIKEPKGPVKKTLVIAAAKLAAVCVALSE